MAKKGVKVDDLIELVLDDRVIDALVTRLTARLTPSLEVTLAARLAPSLEQLFTNHTTKFMATLEATVEKLTTGIVESLCKPVHEKMRSLVEDNNNLRARIDTLENAQRQDSLLIHGLPEATFAEVASNPGGSESGTRPGDRSDVPATAESHSITERTVVSFCRTRLGMEITERDISTAFRIPRGRKEKHRPIVVRFTTRRVRDAAYRARRGLRGDNQPPGDAVYVNEHLTKGNAEIFARARSLLKDRKIARTWTMGGAVYIKRSDSVAEKPQRILSLRDFDEI